GLNIASKGAVTAANLTTGQNSGYGTYIDNTYGTANSAVSINNTNLISDNGKNGLAIYTRGVVKLNQLTVGGNCWLGAYAGASLLTGTSSAQPSIAITGTNSFNSNSGDGLQITAYGALTLNNITASQNSFEGVHLDNTLGTGKAVSFN